MKKQQIAELHTKTFDELRRQLLDIREEIKKTEFDWINGKVSDTNAIRNLKKDTARVMTALGAREAAVVDAPIVEEPKKEVKEEKDMKTKKESKKPKGGAA